MPVQADGLRGFGQVIWGRVDKTVTMQFCHTSNVWQDANCLISLVGVRGFEPPAPASRTQCSTRLSYTPAKAAHIAPGSARGKAVSQPRGLAACRAMEVCQAL